MSCGGVRANQVRIGEHHSIIVSTLPHPTWTGSRVAGRRKRAGENTGGGGDSEGKKGVEGEVVDCTVGTSNKIETLVVMWEALVVVVSHKARGVWSDRAWLYSIWLG